MFRITLTQLNYWARQVEEKHLAVRSAMDSREDRAAALFNEYTRELHKYRLALREYNKEIEGNVNNSG